MRLRAALGASLLYTSMGPEAREAWNCALEIAHRLGDADYQLRALWGLWVDRLNSGAFAEALSMGERFLAAAAGSADANDVAIGHRLVGIALHFLGEQTRAATHLERMLGRYVAPPNLSHIIRFQFDPRVTARCFQAKVRWLQGFPDEATRIVATTIDEARLLGHELSLVNSLGQGACLIALFTGDLDAADAYTEHARRARHAPGHRAVEGLEPLLRRRRAGAARRARRRPRAPARRVRAASGDAAAAALHGAARRARPGARRERRMGGVEGHDRGGADARGATRRGLVSGRAASDPRRRSPSREGRAGDAERHLLQAIDCARRQEVLSLELRAATSLARLRGSDDSGDGIEPVVAVYRRFTEGFDTADLVAARELIGDRAFAL